MELCEWCGGLADPTTTCPKSIACPSCHAEPGQRCRRPSGHLATELHAARVEAAELRDLMAPGADPLDGIEAA